MKELIDGKKISEKVQEELRQVVSTLPVTPTLVIVAVGEKSRPVKSREAIGKKIGVEVVTRAFPSEITEDELIKEIQLLNNDSTVHGVLFQLPFPESLNSDKIREFLSPEKEIEGMHPFNMGKLLLGKPEKVSSVTLGVMRLLEEYKVDLEGKHVVVVGRGNVVGKPMAQLLLQANATVTIAHSHTKNLAHLTKMADILVVAIGRGHFITKDYVQKDAIVIDIGMSFTEEGKMLGDVDFAQVQEQASLITPVPGGVGPMNTTMLMAQVIENAQRY